MSEYGIADLRGRTDEDCVLAMASISGAGFQTDLLEKAKRHLKLRRDFRASDEWKRNTTARLRQALAPFRGDGTLPDYPLGSDFTEVEQRLVKALGWLKANTATPVAKASTLLRALFKGHIDDAEAMARMGLDAPQGLGARLSSRLVAYALHNTGR